MLSMSTAEDVEFDQWRTRYGRCALPATKMRPRPHLETVIERLPLAMSLILSARLRSGGWLGPMRLEADEVASIETGVKMPRHELMVMLLDVASALAQTTAEGEHIGAVAEGKSGALYVGAPLSWKGQGIKFSVHGAQAAVLNAWNHGEKSITSLMVEVPPCACCRQFLRELKDWKTLKIIQASDGPLSLSKDTLKEMELDLQGLRLIGVKGQLMEEPKRSASLSKTNSTNDLSKQATAAAAASYAPYSRNYAGVALRTKHGDTHHGCYVEVRESVAGILAAESALVDLALGGGTLDSISEMLLVEMRGTVTQFPATQRLAMAMGNIPFRFMTAS